MSTAETVNLLNAGDAEARRARVVPISAITRATDERLEREDREKREREDAARLEAEAIERDDNCDRLANAINSVAATEYQRGRIVTSRKGAWAVIQIKALLDALHGEDAPVIYPQFAKGALGGRSTLPMAAVEKGLGTAAGASVPVAPSAAPPEKASSTADVAAAATSAYAADAPSSQSPTDDAGGSSDAKEA